MKLRIDIEIEDHVAHHHFKGNKKAAKAYLANEMYYSVGLLESDMIISINDLHRKVLIEDNQGSREA